MYRIASMLHIASHDLAMIENEDFDTFDEYKRIVSDVYEQKIRSMKAFEKKSKKKAYQNLQMSIRHVRKCLEHVVEDLQEMTSIEDLQEAIKQRYSDLRSNIMILRTSLVTQILNMYYLTQIIYQYSTTH